MATVTISYASSAAISCNCTGLASSDFTAGTAIIYESAWVDNSSSKYVDALAGGKISVATASANTQIVISVASKPDDDSYPSVLDGTEGVETVANSGILAATTKVLAVIPVPVATTGLTYYYGPVSVAQCFGGILPRKWCLTVQHNTGNNLDGSSGGQAAWYSGIKYDVA
jgi:hypothetical protein